MTHAFYRTFRDGVHVLGPYQSLKKLLSIFEDIVVTPVIKLSHLAP